MVQIEKFNISSVKNKDPRRKWETENFLEYHLDRPLHMIFLSFFPHIFYTFRPLSDRNDRGEKLTLNSAQDFNKKWIKYSSVQTGDETIYTAKKITIRFSRRKLHPYLLFHLNFPLIRLHGRNSRRFLLKLVKNYSTISVPHTIRNPNFLKVYKSFLEAYYFFVVSK